MRTVLILFITSILFSSCYKTNTIVAVGTFTAEIDGTPAIFNFGGWSETEATQAGLSHSIINILSIYGKESSDSNVMLNITISTPTYINATGNYTTVSTNTDSNQVSIQFFGIYNNIPTTSLSSSENGVYPAAVSISHYDQNRIQGTFNGEVIDTISVPHKIHIITNGVFNLEL